MERTSVTIKQNLVFKWVSLILPTPNYTLQMSRTTVREGLIGVRISAKLLEVTSRWGYSHRKVLWSVREYQSPKPSRSKQLSEHLGSIPVSRSNEPGKRKMKEPRDEIMARLWRHLKIFREGQNLVEVFLQFLYPAHVILIFDTQSNRLGIGTRAIELKRTWVSVYVVQQKFGCVLPQQPDRQTPNEGPRKLSKSWSIVYIGINTREGDGEMANIKTYS